MPVVTMFTIAAAFWGAHGYTVTQPVTWEWFSQQPSAQLMLQAHGGGGHVWLNRVWWDEASNQDRCVVIAHELGHAVWAFEHADSGIMVAMDNERPVPGACVRSRRAWRQAAARTTSTGQFTYQVETRVGW